MSGKPSVLFVCVHNAGKSQMAAGLMTDLAGDAVDVHSAGTAPGTKVNAEAAASLAELGIDITTQQPKVITEERVRAVDVVVILGQEAQVEPVEGTQVERWDTVEPSQQGIEGMERMRLVRDDIAVRVRVRDLAGRLGTPAERV
ncbi:arsenate-mycothiol transferase ArsC [Modestobacter lacusdianchii]